MSLSIYNQPYAIDFHFKTTPPVVFILCKKVLGLWEPRAESQEIQGWVSEGPKAGSREY